MIGFHLQVLVGTGAAQSHDQKHHKRQPSSASCRGCRWLWPDPARHVEHANFDQGQPNQGDGNAGDQRGEDLAGQVQKPTQDDRDEGAKEAETQHQGQRFLGVLPFSREPLTTARMAVTKAKLVPWMLSRPEPIGPTVRAWMKVAMPETSRDIPRT